MSIYIGTKKSKLFLGDNKIKKIYVGTEKVYSSGNIVTYYVDTNIMYQEEVDSEASCLSPTTFTPELSGYTFVGWREDAVASGEVLSSKVMGDEPISLYAVFKKTFTLSFANNYASGGATNPVSGNQYYNNGNIVNPVVTLPADGYTRSGLTFIKWVLGTVGTKITLTADTTTRAVCKYSDMVPTYINWSGPGVFHDNGGDYSVYVDGTKYSQLYWASVHCNRGDFIVSANGSNLWGCSSYIDNGYAKLYINGVDVSNGSMDLEVGATTVDLPLTNVRLRATKHSDASASKAVVTGIKLIGRTVS